MGVTQSNLIHYAEEYFVWDLEHVSRLIVGTV